MFFQHENRFRYKFFDIVQFSRSCSASAMRLTTWLFYHRSDFLSSSFFEVFRFLSNLERSLFLGADRNFRTSIGSFRFTSSWDSEVILLSQRLALKYNTIHRAGCQHFFASFFRFFRADSNRLHPLVFFRQRLFVCYNVLYKGQSIDDDLYYAKESPRFPCTNCQEVPSQILFRKFSVIFGESYKTQNVVVLPLTYH